jgi:hypothetical protein
MSRSVLRVIIGAAVLALLLAFYLNGSREARRADGHMPERATRALEATVPHRIDAGASAPGKP